MASGSASEPQIRLRLRVTAVAESVIRSGHPWIYAGSIKEQNRAGTTGEIAVIYDRHDAFLAIGLFDAESPLRVRVLHQGKRVKLDDSWWRTRLQTALDRRRSMLDDATTGYRLVNGESDGWPGLVLDRYGDALVVKLYTAAWLPRWPEVQTLIQETLTPTRLILRLSRNIQAVAAEKFSLADGTTLRGDPNESKAMFLETDVRFEADVQHGQKTGFFLDQRDNRRRVETLARGRVMLNAFSFSGGFSVYAARGGARAVTEIDLSVHALASAERNFQLNAHHPGVAACRREAVQGDAFRWLHDNQEPRYDLVVLDPPSLARRESERAGAIKAYETLAQYGIGCLRPGGILVAASCSAHVSATEFFSAVRSAARKWQRQFAELETTHHPPDHPATFPEAEYLKCIYLRM